MKKLIKLVGLAFTAISFSAPVWADTSKPNDVGVTNTLALSATQTANMGSAQDIRNWDNIALLLRFAGAKLGDEGATGNITVTFARTIDDPTSSSALWDTATRFTWAVPANGTNVVVGVTNIPRDSISGIAGLKVVSIQNGTTNRIDSVKLEIVGKSRSR